LNGRTGSVAIAEEAIADGSPHGLTDGPAVASAPIAGTAVVGVATGAAYTAKLKGFEGDACPECGNFTMVRNGTCLKCTTCGGTTGCS
jgi:ribonucleoside-diphosphate reductase alpha chain